MCGGGVERPKEKFTGTNGEYLFPSSQRERKLAEGRGMSLEDISMRSDVGAVRRDELTRPKEQRERKVQETDAADLGLKIYAAAANAFPE